MLLLLNCVTFALINCHCQNYSQHGMGSGQPIIRPTSQVAQGGMSTTAGRGGYNREIAGSGNGPSGGRITGKIESALGSAVGSESLQAKGLQKQREAEAIKLQAAELSEAERLEEEARMRRQRAVGHGELFKPQAALYDITVTNIPSWRCPPG